MKTFLAVVGALCVLAFLAGALIPDMALHVYLGSNSGAAKWHAKHSTKENP